MHTEILQYVTDSVFFFHAVLFHPAKPIYCISSHMWQICNIDHVYLVSPGLKLFCIDMHMHDFREK